VGKTVPVARIQRGMGGQGDMVTFDYKEISIRLNVTPHVGGDGQITMFVNPIIEEISDWKILFGNEAPVTDKRSVNSIITVKDGETLVIGGLVKNQQTETVKRVWLLGSLPLIGRFFQHEIAEDRQTDVMIFITPTIVPDGAA
jgi:type II secretory pathway component GspD/PulD (secretin)